MSDPKRYRVLQPMRFVLDGGPDTEVLPEGVTVGGLRKDQLEPADARALDIQRKLHKGYRLKGQIATFLWRGKTRFGVIGGDRADLKAVTP